MNTQVDCYGVSRHSINEYGEFKIGMIVRDKYSKKSFRIDNLTVLTYPDNKFTVIASEYFTAYSCYELNTLNLEVL